MSVARYPLVTIDVPPDEVEDAVAIAFELGAQGVEQRDQSTLVAGGSPGMATLVISFADPTLAATAVAELNPAWHPTLSELVGDSWRDEWKKHFVHQTQLRGAVLLDVGTGSGILALVGLALGAARVRAIDIDPDAIEVTMENARRNALEDRIEADTSPLAAIGDTFHVVTANIEARALIDMAPELTARVRPGGILMLSGVLRDQADQVRRAFSALELVETPAHGEWVAVVLAYA